VHVRDGGSGVNSGTITIAVTENGAAVSGTVNTTGSPSDYTVTFDPSAPLGNVKTIIVSVSASDLAGYSSSQGFSFQTASAGGTTWDIADDDGDGIPNSEEDLLGTSRTTKTIFVRPKKCTGLDANRECINWVYWSEFVEVLFPHASKAGFADIYAFTDAGIEVVVIGAQGAQTPYWPMQDFSYDPGVATKNLNPSGAPIDFDPSVANWQGPHCDIMEVSYYPPESGKFCTEVGGCHKNYGHLYFTSSSGFLWDTKGFTPNTTEYHNYYIPILYGYVQKNYFEEACFDQLSKGELPKYEQAGTWPQGYQCNVTPINQCYQFRSTYSSPLNLNKSGPPFGPPDTWVEFKPISYNADKRLNCFDNDCGLTQPLAVNETQYDFNAVLRRTIMHEMGHAFLLATTADHCSGATCILQDGVEDWTLHPFGIACGHKGQIQGAVHNSRH